MRSIQQLCTKTSSEARIRISLLAISDGHFVSGRTGPNARPEGAVWRASASVLRTADLALYSFFAGSLFCFSPDFTFCASLQQQGSPQIQRHGRNSYSKSRALKLIARPMTFPSRCRQHLFITYVRSLTHASLTSSSSFDITYQSNYYVHDIFVIEAELPVYSTFYGTPCRRQKKCMK